MQHYFPQTTIAAVFILVLVISVTSCKHEPALPPAYNADNYTVENTCDSDSVYFANAVLPLIVSRCATSGCHDRGKHESKVVLTDYNSITVTGKIKQYKPEDSDLYEVISDGSMPPGAPFSQAEKELIFNWIMQGAQNNHCTSCDTSALATYSGYVAPLIQNKCIGCHNGTQTNNSINLSTYSNVHSLAITGELVDCLTGNGYKRMPYQSAALPQCEIDKVTEWVNNGSLNN